MKLIKSYEAEDQFIAKELRELLPIDETQASFLSNIFGTMFKGYFPNILEVGDRYARIDEWYDVWKFFLGWKDGVVAVTGPTSLFSQCDGNLTRTNGVFYFHYVDLFSPVNIDTNFGDAANRDNSIR